MRTWRRLLPLLLLLPCALRVGAGSLQGQEPAGAGVLAGAVLDVDTHAPLPGTVVTIQPDPGGVFPAAPGAAPFATTTRSAMTDSAGQYRFAGLAPGRYRVDAVRPGYRSYSVGVELRGAAPSTVLLGLSVEPIPLQPVRPTATREDPFPRPSAATKALTARAAPARLAPGSPLSTDAHELTRADVIEAVTTGEPDLFRAIRRLPGISAFSDFTAEVWTRGAPWHETRVFLDGVPVFDPLHTLGSLSGISPQAVGALWVYPGVHPAHLPEGAAGAIELRTRHGAGEGRVNGAIDLSLLSAGASFDRRAASGRSAWMISARHSSLDWLSRAVSDASDRPELRVPFDFSDAVGRFDLRLSGSQSLELSAMGEDDRWHGRVRQAAGAGDASWGNVVARASLVSSVAGAEGRHTIGFSRRAGRVRIAPVSMPVPTSDPFTPDAAPRTTTTIEYLGLTGEWRTAPGRVASWRAGYELTRQNADYAGEKAIAAPILDVYSAAWASDSMSANGPPLRNVDAWVEATYRPGGEVTIQPALRLEGGDGVLGSGRLRPAPRLMLRWEPLGVMALSVGLGRSWQYAQSLAPTGVRRASLTSDDAWLLAGPDVPALRSDVFTAGAEAWLGAWRLTTNAYLRRTDGVALPDPTPGLAFAPRPVFVVGRRAAAGIELSARRVAPGWNASIGYTLARSVTDAAGLSFHSGADRRHVVDAMAMMRLAPPLRFGAAFTAATGAPYTPVTQERIGSYTVSRLGDPNSERGPAYTGLDLLLDWSGRIAGKDVGAWLQLQNALGRDNGIMYVGSRPGCVGGWCGPRAVLENRYERGLPRLPVLGARVRL